MAEEEKSKKELKEEKKKAKQAEKEAKKAAKNGEGNAEDDEEEEGGGILVGIVVVLIIAVWLAIFALIIKMDVGGFGSTVLYPIFKDVPYINKILPEVEEYAEEDAQYQFATMDDAVARVKELEEQLAAAQTSSSDTASRIAELETQTAELQSYKENEAAFEAEKEKFYEEVVFSDNAPDISNYKEYYESIEPDSAASIYKEVVEQLQVSDEISDYVATYSAMEAEEAAEIFDAMTDNLALVAKILSAMDSSSRGDILAAMDTDTAAQLTKIMEP